MPESEVRLTRGEYWLLESVVTDAIPLNMLASSELAWILNKKEHGLIRQTLIETLVRLFDLGWISAKFTDVGNVPSRFDQQLKCDQIIAAMEERGPWFSASAYRLTPEGGAVWEAFAAPDWERFVLIDEDFEEGIGVRTCLSERVLHHQLESSAFIEGPFDPDSVKTKITGPWQATYWKTLPVGFQANYRRLAVSASGSVPMHPYHRLAFAGYCESRDGWYRWR